MLVAGLTKTFWGILFLALCCNPGQMFGLVLNGTHSVTLMWDLATSPEVAGHRLYYGLESRNYSSSLAIQDATKGTVSGLVAGVTYFLAVTAHDASGLESGFSEEVTYVPGLSTVRISVDAIGKILTVQGAPGRTCDIWATRNSTEWAIIGRVTIAASGSVSFRDSEGAGSSMSFYRAVETPSGVHGHKSSGGEFLLNVTGQSGHTYDIQTTHDLVTWAVAGRVTLGDSGLVTFTDPNAASFPMSFYRSLLTPPGIQIRRASGGPMLLTVTGQSGRTYEIQATQDFLTWTIIGRVTLGDNGVLEYNDATAADYPARVYRTRETGI